MRGITARLGKGFFDPVASPTKESLRALLWNLQSRGLPSPCTLDRDNTNPRMRKCILPRQRRFHSPLETHDRWLQRPQPRGFHAPRNPDQRAFVPFGNQTGECEPRPPGRHFAPATDQGGALEPFITGGRVATGSDKRQRTRLITFRVTDDEYARYQERASRAGLAVGAFARAAGLEGAGPRARRRRPVEHAALAQLMAAMNRVGNNLNQIARQTNLGLDIDVPRLRNALIEYHAVIGAIYEALGMESADDHQGQK